MQELFEGANVGLWQLFLLLIILCFVLFPIVALISILRNEFKGNEKLIWVLVVLLLPIIGSILYFVIGRPKVKRISSKVRTL